MSLFDHKEFRRPRMMKSQWRPCSVIAWCTIFSLHFPQVVQFTLPTKDITVRLHSVGVHKRISERCERLLVSKTVACSSDVEVKISYKPVVKAATVFAFHRNQELILQTRKDILLLERKLAEEKERLEWERLFASVESSTGYAGSHPWDPIEEEEETPAPEIGRRVFNRTYVSLSDNLQSDILGQMRPLSRAFIENTFDGVIQEQKAKNQDGWWNLLGSGTQKSPAEKSIEDKEWESKKAAFESQTTYERLWLELTNRKFAKYWHEQGRRARGAHRVTWRFVEEKVEELMNQILKEKYEGAQGDFVQRLHSLNEYARMSKLNEVLRLPNKQINSAQVTAPEEPNNEGMYEDDDENGFWMLPQYEQDVVDVLRSDFDAELDICRRFTDSLIFAGEELIRDANLWCEPGHALPYKSMTQFRDYVNQAFSREGENGTTAERFWRVRTVLLPRDEALELVFLTWGGLMPEDLMRSDRLVLEVLMRDARWREMEKVAESEWRLSSPEQYRRFEVVRTRRLEALRTHLARRRDMRRLLCEGQLALDEYNAVLIDLDVLPPGRVEEPPPAQLGVSALSGRGREMGMPVEVELAAQVALVVCYAWVFAAPVVVSMLSQPPPPLPLSLYMLAHWAGWA